MLTELHVRDLGVIGDLTVTLGPGMTALTGETGAGKTLLVEALDLVLGGKAQAGLVRTGASEAVVEARFAPDSDSDAEQETVLARAVPADGRSRAWIDGRMATMAQLAEVGAGLVDIHGQHDHQSLKSPAAQRRALDAFARIDPSARQDAQRRLSEIDRRLDELGGDEHQRAREADVLRHQVAEIETAALADDTEDEGLRAEEARLADLAAIREAAALALGLLASGDDGPVASDLVGRALSALSAHEALSAWSGRLEGVAAELGDVATDLRRVAETWEDDPELLASIQLRRKLLADLRHKYGPTLAEVRAYGAEARARLESLEGAAVAGERLAAERRDVEAELRREEDAVGRARREAAPALAAAVGERLAGLAMAGARFEVAVGPDRAGDEVTFLLAANPGEPAQPLARVASGGELAAAMLALRLVAAGGPQTMVFDEVDAGVGGAAALSLAGALEEASRDRQVLVVTHLAQVAARADAQVAVTKHVASGRTVTEAAALVGDARVEEVSRMLSGHPHSDTARAHAEELLRGGGSASPVASTAAGRRVD